MRSPDLFLGSVRRALFPSIDWAKVRFRGGWAALPIYIVMILIYPASLAQAGWVDLNTQFPYIALAGALLGTIVGSGRMRTRRATFLAAIAGSLTVVIFTIVATTGPSLHLLSLIHI